MAEVKATNITWHEGHVTREERAALLKQRGATLWFTFTDAGEPGRRDQATYLIWKDGSGGVPGVFDAGDTLVLQVGAKFLTFGNHQAHDH